MRLIDADQFGVISLQGKSEDFIAGVAFMFDKIHEAPTVEAYTHNQVQDLIALNKKLSKERPYGEWIEVDIKPLPYGGYTCNYKCNNCNYFTKEYHLNFCPICGAPMTEEGFRKYNGLKGGNENG